MNLKQKLKHINIEKYIQYAMLIILVLTTRSVFAHTNIDFHFNIIIILLGDNLLLIKCLKGKIELYRIKKVYVPLMIYYIYILVFMIFNNIGDISNFISTFMIILPSLFLIYYLDKDNKSIYKTLISFSNIIIIISIISLIIYILGPLSNILKPTNTFYIDWGKIGNVDSYLNLAFNVQRANVLGVNLIRNTSIFTEAPMYALNLVIALAIQLFLKEKPNKGAIILLMVSVLTTYSAIGIAISTVIFVISLLFMKEKDNKEKKKNSMIKNIFMTLIIIMLIVASIYMYIERKNHTESYNIRLDDFKACFAAWTDNLIFGTGYNSTETIQQHMSSFRLHNTGISNSILALLAQDGIYLALLYLVPTIYILKHYMQMKLYKRVMFILVLIALFITTTFQHTIIMMYFLAFAYVIIFRDCLETKNVSNNIRLYIITHKKFEKTKLQEYLPIQVGAENNEKLGYLQDNIGENISSKNPNYCELTGIYWIWKNDNENDVIGISHYRRYFTQQLIFKNKNKILNQEQVEEIFNKGYDIILPKKEIYRENVYKQYCQNSGFATDLNRVEEIIRKQCPEYIESYKKIMEKNRLHQFNMMICSKDLYNEYCEWLFNILFELEKEVDLSQYNEYQKRIYGFLAERLLNVWVDKNNLKIKTIRVINIDESIRDTVKINLRRIKNGLIYLLKNKNKD